MLTSGQNSSTKRRAGAAYMKRQSWLGLVGTILLRICGDTLPCTPSGGGTEGAPSGRGGGAVAGPQLDAVIATYKPAEPDPDDVAMFEQEGFSTPVAETLATSYGAAEIAQEQQAIKVPDATRSQVEINAPPAVGWDLKLRTICADLMSAARTINDAKMRDLRRPVTAELLAKVHAEWLYQMERIANIHEDAFSERVSDHAEKPTL